MDSPIALEYIDRYPTPRSAESLGERRMAAFMARQAFCGRHLLERLRAAPRTTVDDVQADAKGECVRAVVAVLRPLVPQDCG